MTNVIDVLLVRWNEEYTKWKEMPDLVTAELSVPTISSQSDDFDETPRQKKEQRKFLDELVSAVVVLHNTRTGQRNSYS